MFAKVKTCLTCARHRVADVLTKLDGGDEVDGGGGREAEGLEVGGQGSRGVLEVQSGEDQLVDRAARRVDQVQQLSVVRPDREIFIDRTIPIPDFVLRSLFGMDKQRDDILGPPGFQGSCRETKS